MRQYGHGPVQIRILHQIPLHISGTADFAHNRCGQICCVERRAGRILPRPSGGLSDALPDDLGGGPGAQADDDAEGLAQGLLIRHVGQGHRRLVR
jgi:hypothetical protein